MSNLAIAIGQMDIVWLSPKENIVKLHSMCSKVAGKAKLLVLPEMWSTGFCTDVAVFNSTWYVEGMQALKDCSLTYHIAIIGSIPVFEEGKWFNRMVCVHEGQIMHYYDKMHLFSYGGEDKYFSSGIKNASFLLFGVRVRLLVCYDLRFPYLTCNSETPEIIIYCANWPTVRIAHWQALLRARAIENQAFVLGVNRVGLDGFGYGYNGCSEIISFDGQTLVSLDNVEQTVIAAIDVNSLYLYRAKYPFLSDRQF